MFMLLELVKKCWYTSVFKVVVVDRLRNSQYREKGKWK